MSATEIVSTAWLADHLADPDLVVLDGSYYLPAQGRDAGAEYLAAHIPDAIRFDIDAVKDAGSDLPHMLPSADVFGEAVGRIGISPEMRIVAYDGLGLFSAPRVAWTFRVFGAGRVAVLDGGLPAWTAEGRPTEAGSQKPRKPTTFAARLDAGAVAGVEDIRSALAGSAQVVDARSPARFKGDEPEARPGTRSGHMPGALNLHYGELVTNGRLADADAIRAAMDRAGIDPARPIVTTCGSGVTAPILSLAFAKAGRPARALYDGSWSEWGSRTDTPVETG